MSVGLKLYDLGYTDLVSVVPPGAQISPKSRIDEADRGKVPGKLGTHGWYGYNFVTAEAPTRGDVAQYDAWGANIGLMARRFPAIDLDVRSTQVRDVGIALAREMFGDPPVRLSVAPRALLMFRTEEPFSRIALAATENGVSHLVEVLAGDRQYLIAGTHPSGQRYRWTRVERPDELPVLTRESALAYLQALAERLRQAGLDVELIGTGELRAAVAPPQEDLQAPSIEALRELVGALPNSAEVAPDWDSWIKVGHAIKAAAAGDPEGLDIWLEWTARCTRVDPADEAEASAQYERMRAPHRVGWSYLQELADEHGEYSSAQDDFAAHVDPNAEPAPARPAVGLPEQLNDEGVVRWLLPQLRGLLRYAPATKLWYVWGGHRWRVDGVMEHEQVIRRHLRRLCELLRLRGEAAPGKEGLPYLRAAEAYQSAAKITGIVRLLQAPLACSPSDFDANPWLLNTPGGVIDLRTGERTESTPDGMHSRSTLVAPRPGATPLWDRFLADATGGDAEMQRYVMRLLGYALTGDMREKALWYVWGAESDTGKSTLIRTVMQLFGSYADTVAPDVFLNRRGETIPAELARMPGVRLVTATEPAHGRSWDEQRIKSITGGDTIEVRFLYGQPFTYTPAFKIIIVGNSEPEIRHLDGAMLRRIHILPLNHPVPRDRQIANLSQRMIEEEGPAILQKIVDSCMEWQREGMQMPGAAAAKTQEYLQDEDLIGQWAAEECEFNPDAEVTRNELYAAWAIWCRARGEDPGKQKSFKRTLYPLVKRYGLADRQIGERRLHGYRGIRLRSPVVDGTEFNA